MIYIIIAVMAVGIFMIGFGYGILYIEEKRDRQDSLAYELRGKKNV